jgi:hypothetical protein
MAAGKEKSQMKTMQMKLIDVKFADSNGQHSRYTVRSTGRGFYMPIDKLNNVCPLANGDAMFTTRQAAWDYLRETAA